MEQLINIAIPVFLLGLGYFIGRMMESSHYRSIREREAKWVDVPAVSYRTLDDPRPVESAELVFGSVVVSIDYYKRFLAGLRNIFGGEVGAFSSLIDRARREALLRMKESCPDADLFMNCRLETSSISKGEQKATGTVEMLAYATAVKFKK